MIEWTRNEFVLFGFLLYATILLSLVEKGLEEMKI